MKKFFYYMFRPALVFVALLKRLPLGFEFKVSLDALPYPHYAYGTLKAAEFAKKLGLKKISVIEFGVSEGNGLIHLDRYAAQVSRLTGIDVEVYGFDTGQGLPKPIDYRDHPYMWKEGIYKLDAPMLQKKLSRAKLVLGDVKHTTPSFFEKYRPAPVGFIIFDLDYYSSTVDALRIFDAKDSHLLPRVLTYFDDVRSSEDFWANEFTGELLAIKEFNERSQNQKLAPVWDLWETRIVPAGWNYSMYGFHRFNHSLYNKDVFFN